jgi:chaperonin GroEL
VNRHHWKFSGVNSRPSRKVVRFALQDAASVAASIATTEAGVVERPEKKAAGGMPGGGMGDMDF